MSALQNEINKLNTLKESFSELSKKVLDTQAVLTELNHGKQEMVDALATKNVQSSTDKTLSGIASDIRSIAQSPITIDGGEMYAKQLYGSITEPNYWNLYDVLTQLLSDGRLITYGGILLAEYDCQGDTIHLEGAGAGGAYVVSDKIGDSFIMYTTDTIHTWSTEYNGKANRWVAYCFAEEYHNYSVLNSEPKSLFIGRKIGVITTNQDGALTKIVVPDGNELKDFGGKFKQNWDKTVVFKNFKYMSSFLIYDSTNVENIYIQADTISMPEGNNGSSLTKGLTNIRSMIIDANTITGRTSSSSAYGEIFPNSQPSITTFCVRAMYASFGSYTAPYDAHYSNLKVLQLCIEQGLFDFKCGSGGNIKTNSIYIGYITNDKSKSVTYKGDINRFITNIYLQDGWCKPLIISEYNQLTEENMINHILKRLKQDEEMCGSGVTITLGATNLAKLTSEEAVALLDSLTNTYGYTFA